MYVWVGALVKKGANALFSCAPPNNDANRVNMREYNNP